MAASDETTRDETTVLERPFPRRGGSSSELTEADPVTRATPPPPRSLVLTNPGATTLGTMRAEEVQTTRAIIGVGRWLGLAALAPVPFLGGNVALRVTFAGLVLASIAVGLMVDRRLRDPARYDERTILILAISGGLATFAGLIYWGIFSAAQMFPALGLYFYARRVALGSALVVLVAAVVIQAIVATVIITGVAADPGIYRPDLDAGTLWVGHVLIQLGQLASFLLGRYSFRASRVAIERLHEAMRIAAQREVLLNEIRQDLDRALKVGEPGRYTGQVMGSFRLGNVIGHGGMGEVYEAEPVSGGAPVAVKALPIRRLSDEHTVARFRREIDLVSSLRSPHIVRVLESSEPEDPIPFLVMERLYGDSLAELIRGGDADVDIGKLVTEVAAALDAARAAGIVHRDLKPSNLMLASEPGGGPLWKVLDFGVATLSSSSGTLTAGSVVGTPHYMAPEQARGETVDHRADVYALGAIAYRLITGRPPFTGRDSSALLYRVVHATPTPPSQLADVSVDVDEVLGRALAKAPGERHDEAGALAAELVAALAT